ncbi:MAG: hypothetical protein RIG68_24845 [Imperialibacter sp.]|uniref:hypothetical protein n=1 Tax=Imperialibacter sp. TaxID=2038411 RepID=UPI0032EB69BC
MNEIKKIVRIVTNRVKKNVSLIDVVNNEDNPGKEQQLFNSIQSGVYTTDDDAAFGMYGTNGTDQRYRMLKSRLRTKLNNLLYFADFNDSRGNISFPFEQECHSHIFRAKILYKEGEYELAEKSIKKALTISKESEFTDLTLIGLKMLRIIYSESFRPNQLRKAIGQIKKYEVINRLEEESLDIFYLKWMQLGKSVHSRKVHLESTIKAVEVLRKLWEKGGSYALFENYYRLRLWTNELLGDYSSVVAIAEEAYDLVNKGAVNPLRFDMRHHVYTRTYACLRAKDYDKGIKYAEEGMNHISRSSRNWFSHMENYVLLALHNKNYLLADEVINQVTRNPYVDKISTQSKERWELYKGYLYFIMPDRNVEDVLSFKDIYERLPFYSQDKQGFMVAILILEFMDFLKKDRLDLALTKLPNSERYIYRYLNQNQESQREKLFLKLISIIVQCSFNPDMAAKKGKRYLERLAGTPEPGDAFAEVEIVPYEQLWDILMGFMKNAHVKPDYAKP